MNISNTPSYKYNKPLQFTGYTSAFSKKLQQVVAKGNVDDSEKQFLISQLQKKMILDRNIGRGCQGSIFKIDDKYVAKRYLDTSKRNPHLTIYPDLKFSALTTYYGEPVAKYDNIEILKNVSANGKHIPAGIPMNYSSISPYRKSLEYYENEYLPLFSSLPQKSFDAIAKDCSTLNKMKSENGSYTFDFLNPNNFVLAGRSLRITDEIKETPVRNPNTISKLLVTFLQKMSCDEDALYSEKAIPYRRELFKKITLAGMKNNLPLGDTFEDSLIWENVANYLCKAKASAFDIINNLTNLKFQVYDPELRLQKAEEYLDGIYDKKETVSFRNFYY